MPLYSSLNLSVTSYDGCSQMSLILCCSSEEKGEDFVNQGFDAVSGYRAYQQGKQNFWGVAEI